MLDNRAVAARYKVDVDKIETLASSGYFRSVMGNLGTPESHKVPLLIPEENS